MGLTRRELMPLLGALIGPRVARAQQADRLRRIGMLMMYAENDAKGQTFAAAFRNGLAKLGWTQPSNVQLDYCWASSDPQTIQRFASELVVRQPDLILSSSAVTTAALQQETRTVPVIFGNLIDPVGSGFVASLRRPGGNITGFVNVEPAVTGKWLALLKSVAPSVTRVAAIFNPAAAPYIEEYLSELRAVAPSLGVEPVAAPIREKPELESTIAAQARQPNSGLIVMPDGFMFAHLAQVTSIAAAYRVPAVYFFRAFAEHGGLLSYGNDIVDNYRRAAAYADRILRGESPSELPVQSPVKFELVINLRTARALDLTVPPMLLTRADEVIE